jgi:hypothetical protein
MTEKQTRFQDQVERDHGKYKSFNRCECCNKSAGADYYSFDDCNEQGGFGVTVCGKCAAKYQTAANAKKTLNIA